MVAPGYVFELDVPVLGICMACRLAKQLGGEVQVSSKSEFGFARVQLMQESQLLGELKDGIEDDESYLDV